MTFYSNVKQKSYTLNPRGKPLYDDANRFGTKMLEKMGWSKGKGLGVNEDGEQNFIRVSHKTDQKGMGYHDRDDQWTGHESQFNSLLESLHNSRNASDEDEASDDQLETTRTGFGFDSDNKKSKKSKKSKSIKETLSGNSLEELSKKSSVRVHYRKFTRGKDISKYSEKDLANIFGKKCVNGDIIEKVVEEPEQNMDISECNYGITTIETGTTIQDYFKKRKQCKGQENDLAQEDQLQELPEKKRKKRDKEPKPDPDPNPNPNEIETIAVEESPSSKKKKKKSKKEPNVEQTIIVSDENSDCEIVSIKMKKKKKKSKRSSDGIQAESGDTAAETTNIDVKPIEKCTKKKTREKTCSDETIDANLEVNTNESIPISNTQFIDGILDILVNSNYSAHSSTALNRSNAEHDVSQPQETTSNIAMDEIFEINRYHAEMFRFVDLDGFPNANLNELSGYGYSNDIELKISEKSKDQTKINDLWDYALINKYGKEVIQAKKAKRYSIKQLKKKNLFTKL